MKEHIPKEVLEIAETLENSGFKAFFVGGCVRDLLLQKKPKDWDITTDATPEQIQALFVDTFYENSFGTVGIVTKSMVENTKVVEVTPFRTEGAYENGRHPNSVSFVSNIEDDLHRRDFTVNALAYRPTNDDFIDLFGGKEDLLQKRLRAVGNAEKRFNEDALRILRGIRLSAELDFALELETMTAISTCAHLLEQISRERIRDELLKILASTKPMPALFVAQRLGLLRYIIPELEEGIGCRQNQAHSFDVFEHLLRSLQHAADSNWSIEIRIAALLHDIGKPASRRWSDEKGDWTFYGHEVIGARMTEKICTDLRLPKSQSEHIVRLVRWHMFFSDPDQITLSAVRRVITNIGKDNIWDLLNLRVCDRIGTGRPKAHPFRLRKYIAMVEQALRDPISVGQLKIDGNILIQDVHVPPGPRMSWILYALLQMVLENPEMNTPEILRKRAVELQMLPDSELLEKGGEGKNVRDALEASAVEKIKDKYRVS